MKPWVSCLTALIALGAAGAFATPVPVNGSVHREVIHGGDSAMSLALRSGLSASQFTEWLHKADASTRKKLLHMRPGDAFDIYRNADGSLASVQIERDDAGRKLAEQSASSSPTPGPLFTGVVGDAVTTLPTALHNQETSLASAAAAQNNKATTHAVVTQLRPGHLLSEELVQHLGHRPIVAAVIDYAREKWHLPSRLPKDSHCTVALVPSKKSGMQLAYVQLDYRGRQQRVYHYVDTQGHELMVGAQGEGFRVVDPLLPVTSARISSGWGWRTQPVLGGNEFHLGIDYAAPTGTPVRATMDGVVDLSEWRGDYGRLVEVKHANGLSTRYGHLSAFATQVHPGSHVRRGEIIGYVGTSGLSTGPHLYYEVWDHGKRIDPSTHQRLMMAANLDTRERGRFRNYVDSVQQSAAP